MTGSDVPPPSPHPGDHLRAALARAGLTQQELAVRLDVPHARVNRWVTGRRAMSIPDLVRVADALGVPIGVIAAGRTSELPVPLGDLTPEELDALLRVARLLAAHH